ncbi:glycosyltransferase family 2 protein [Candidatus Roizmanbacteria bacterium]|nr:glycosyltransferase family 2 protein [Candidatus Roizmanbacteria bacterium]
MKSAVIVIPTYNEARTIETLITGILDIQKHISGWHLEILVVDSHSPDGTSAIVKRLTKKYPIIHLLETKKEGLGKAYIAGFTYAIEKLDPYVLFEIDGDLSHSPKKIPEFLGKIEEGTDFVIGSRYIKGGSIPKDWALHRKLFSVLGNVIVRFGLMKLSVSDWTSGFRAIKKWIVSDVISELEDYSGYVFQVALVDKAIKRGAKVQEVPIHFIDRQHGVSKINSAQYIVQTLLYIPANSSFFKYVVVGVTGAVLDYGISYLFIEQLRWYIWLSTLISAESAIISNFVLNNFWSFSHKKLEPKKSVYIPKFIKFNLISSGALLIQAGGVQLGANLFGAKFWWVYKTFIIAFVIIPYSWLLYNKIIWRDT